VRSDAVVSGSTLSFFYNVFSTHVKVGTLSHRSTTGPTHGCGESAWHLAPPPTNRGLKKEAMIHKPETLWGLSYV